MSLPIVAGLIIGTVLCFLLRHDIVAVLSGTESEELIMLDKFDQRLARRFSNRVVHGAANAAAGTEVQSTSSDRSEDDETDTDKHTMKTNAAAHARQEGTAEVGADEEGADTKKRVMQANAIRMGIRFGYIAVICTSVLGCAFVALWYSLDAALSTPPEAEGEQNNESN